MIFGFIKLLQYLRANHGLAQIIRLCYNVFYEAKAFTLFFIFCGIEFGLLYYLAGVDIGGHPDTNHGDGNDYERLLTFIGVFLYAMRTSIGDLQAPNAIIWDNRSEAMVYLIWIIWIFNIYFMLIVYLNFLIAIISQVYENDQANYEANSY